MYIYMKHKNIKNITLKTSNSTYFQINCSNNNY